MNSFVFLSIFLSYAQGINAQKIERNTGPTDRVSTNKNWAKNQRKLQRETQVSPRELNVGREKTHGSSPSTPSMVTT